MIDAPRLLKDLQKLLRELEDDLGERTAEVPEVDAKLRAQYREARNAERTGQAYEVWRDEMLTQVAVAWILGCVFVRFVGARASGGSSGPSRSPPLPSDPARRLSGIGRSRP